MRGEGTLDVFGCQPRSVVFDEYLVTRRNRPCGENPKYRVHARNLPQVPIFERTRQFERELYFRHRDSE